jgi:hypothetical protein
VLARRTGALLAVLLGASPDFFESFKVVKSFFLECCYFTPFYLQGVNTID